MTGGVWTLLAMVINTHTTTEKPMSERLLSTDAVCQLLDISRRTFDRHGMGDTLPSLLIGGRKRFRERDVREWLEGQLARGTP
jgi:predicted DNA-binding transcriptional regulator AlpA